MKERLPADRLQEQRSLICVSARVFPPAHLMGGPAKSLGGLVEWLHEEFRFRVITSAFDGGRRQTMEVPLDAWCEWGRARVIYTKHALARIRALMGSSRDAPNGGLYLNSVFDFDFSMVPLVIWLAKGRGRRVLIAPRGELSEAALAIRPYKKHMFLRLLKLTGVPGVVRWHATSAAESTDIARVFGSEVHVSLAPPLREKLPPLPSPAPRAADDARCRLVFLSRIVPVKNLALLIDVVSAAGPRIRLTIAGPIEDKAYWAECCRRIESAPPDCIIEYVGSVPSDRVIDFLGGYDLFVLPSLSESFGHAILEALAAGTPVLVGRNSPWSAVEDECAGWLCDPTSKTEIASRISEFSELDSGVRADMRRAARGLAERVSTNCESVLRTTEMLSELVLK